MTPNEQAVVDQEESPISSSQCFAKPRFREFIFDVNLSTAVAANGKRELKAPLPHGPLATCSTR